MSFIYPRTASFYRPNPVVAPGDIGYSGESSDSQAPIASAVPCSIQYKRASGGLAANLPADVVSKSIWIFFIPLSAGFVLGTLKDRDIAMDDLGVRYQVAADYWNSLGYQIACERLEA